MAELQISSGADIEAETIQKLIPLYFAALSRFHALVSLYLRSEAAVNTKKNLWMDAAV